MSTYTMQLRTYIEMFTQDVDLPLKEKLEVGRTKLFDFSYPIFDEQYRKEFETKFIRKFYMREIGFETEELFKFYLETWLNENMPYFNRLFESERYKFDPLENMNLTTKHTRDSDKDGFNSSKASTKGNEHVNSESFERDLMSNTPDSRLQITTKDGEGVIEYATTIEENKNKGNQNSSNESSGQTEDTAKVKEKETYVETVIGNHGVKSSSELIKEFRSTFLRIENEIFGEMQKLFMLVY